MIKCYFLFLIVSLFVSYTIHSTTYEVIYCHFHSILVCVRSIHMGRAVTSVVITCGLTHVFYSIYYNSYVYTKFTNQMVFLIVSF